MISILLIAYTITVKPQESKNEDWRKNLLVFEELGAIKGQIKGSDEQFEGKTFILSNVAFPDSSWNIELSLDHIFLVENLNPGYYRLTQKDVGRFTLLDSIPVRRDSLTILAPITVQVDFEPLPPVPLEPIRGFFEDVSLSNEP